MDASFLSKFEMKVHQLHRELNTLNLSYGKREDFQKELFQFLKQLEEVKQEQLATLFRELLSRFKKIELEITLEYIRQSQTEIPRGSRFSPSYLALENIQKELETGKLEPHMARHEIKEVMRHHSFD